MKSLIKYALILLLQKTLATAEDVQLNIVKGSIIGTIEQTAELNQSYYAFKGIPYADPPSRFEEAVLKAAWNGTLNCTYDKAVCVQGNDPVVGSEDCLFLSVYTTSLNSAIPVVVYFHGGYYIMGNSSYYGQGPDFLLQEGIVIVLVQYRLGIFGFMSTEDLACPGNLGLKDQVLALEWIRDNIACFGGDPNKVTIWGQSVGGVSVGYHLLSNRSKGLFHAAIMESGTSLSSFGFNRRSLETAQATALELGILTTNTRSLVDQLNKTDYAKLQSASYIASFAVALTNPLAGIFFGVVSEKYHNKTFFTCKADKLLSEGKFAKVPIILGTTSIEAQFLDDISLLIRSYIIGYEAAPSRLTPPDLADNITTRTVVGGKIKHYFSGFVPLGLNNIALIYLISTDQWVRPTVEFARQVIKSYDKVYMYMFSYRGELGRNTNSSGVAHSEDLNYFFRTQNGDGTSEDHLTRSRVVRLWANFVKYHNPTPTPDPLFENKIWTTVSNNGSSENFNYLDIDNTLNMKTNPYSQYIAFYQDLYKNYGIGDYQTY